MVPREPSSHMPQETTPILLSSRGGHGSQLRGRQRPDLTPCYPDFLQSSSQRRTSLMQLLEGEFLPAFCSWP